MDSAEVVSLITQITQWGVLGFVAISLMFGFGMVPYWTYKAKTKECDTWKALYDSEREAHQHTRDAYTIQGERLQVAIENAKVTERLFREARGHVASPQEDIAG